MRNRMKNISADSIVVERSLFQGTDGGSIPTSAHHFLVGQVSKDIAGGCYSMWHYLGDTEFLSTINFGARVDNKILGAISFGSPNAKVLKGYWTPETQDGWWEIKRLALSPELPKNSESKMIGISIRLLRKIRKVVGIVTYADSGVGHVGTIYKASGFKYLGLTAEKSDFYLRETGKIIQRGRVANKKGVWKPRSRKHLFVKQF